MLPNAMVSTFTFLPFILTGAVTTLTALDFLGFGLPPGSPSLGELLAQGKNNLQAPWLGITAFVVLAVFAEPADLHRRGGARRLRSAEDGPMRARISAIASVPVDDRAKPGHDNWRETAIAGVMAGLVPAIHARPLSIQAEIDSQSTADS